MVPTTIGKLSGTMCTITYERYPLKNKQTRELVRKSFLLVQKTH